MGYELLAMVISLCSIQALEDQKSKWTELQVVEKYRKDCVVWYIDCIDKEPGKGLAGIKHTEHLISCIKKRDL